MTEFEQYGKNYVACCDPDRNRLEATAMSKQEFSGQASDAVLSADSGSHFHAFLTLTFAVS